jgi:ATP-dependent DNA helicase RecG
MISPPAVPDTAAREPDVEAWLRPFPSPRGMRKDSAELMAKVAGGALVRDLLFLMPTGAIDRRARVAIADTQDGVIATIEAEVDAHVPSFSAASPYRVRLRDETGFLTVAYFRPNAEMLKRMWPVGQKRLVSGKVDHFKGERQILHPDHVVDPDKGEAPPNVEPVYPLTAGLHGRQVQRYIKEALASIQAIPEWLDPATLTQRGWMEFAVALRSQHTPESPEDVILSAPQRARLAYDEMFLRQCALHVRRVQRQDRGGRAIAGGDTMARAILEALPYAPTRAQTRAVEEIATDFSRPAPMLRLLQGDVGSGKTLVAALAMSRAAEAGVQSALMAPTDILARQHAEGLLPLLRSAGLKAAILTGKDRARERAETLHGLANGTIQVAIGTHALFQDDVRFKDLGFIVIDEQHRFGVADRMRLVAKGFEPHVLVMSATPIPRTLALAVHGDMDLSILDEKPPGRSPIRTVAMPISRADDVADAIARAAQDGERAYWVCPLIEESEAIDLAAAQDRFDVLRERFGDGVELVHGRLTMSDREAAMTRFKKGESFLLVATTVIEVGVNVPEATIMVIEHAERFGLAQLHQLRGRVGRGEKKGSCILLWRPPLGEGAKERLDALRRSDDGFLIAEIDYKMRGAGDILGVRQSGLPPFRFVSPELHSDLLPAADREARVAVERDPNLASARGRAIRFGLAIFGCDEGLNLSRSG